MASFVSRMARASSATALVAASLLAAACASSGSTPATTSAAAPIPGTPELQQRKTRPASRYYLSQADLMTTQADNVYEAVYKLRPEMIKGRANENRSLGRLNVDNPNPAGDNTPGPTAVGVASVQPVLVYRDGARIGDVESLKSIMISDIVDIRYVPGEQAGPRYGMDASGGVLLITSKPIGQQ
jgi:hypothetical protein